MSDEEKVSGCVNCGVCLKKCPQHIRIPDELKKIRLEVEKQKRSAMVWSPENEYFV